MKKMMIFQPIFDPTGKNLGDQIIYSHTMQSWVHLATIVLCKDQNKSVTLFLRVNYALKKFINFCYHLLTCNW